MSDTEASAQSSEAAEKTTTVAPVSETPTAQDKPRTGSEESTSIEDYRRQVSEMPKSEPGKSQEQKEDEVEAEIQQTLVEDGIVPPATTEEKAPAEKPVPETPAEETIVPEEEEVVDPAKVDTTKPPQYRFRPKNETDSLAMSILKSAEKSGKEMSMKEALEQAETILKKEEPAGTAAASDATLPKTVEEADAKLTSLWAERRQALSKDMDFDKVADLDEQIAALKDHSFNLKQADTASRQNQADQWATTLEKSKVQAVDIYPDVTKADSPLVKEMTDLDEEWKANKNPLFYSPEKPFQLAQQAANRLGIAPKKPGTPVAKPPVVSSQPVKAAAPAARPVQPAVASGGARTTQAANPQGQFDAELEKVTDEESYRTLVKKHAPKPVLN